MGTIIVLNLVQIMVEANERAPCQRPGRREEDCDRTRIRNMMVGRNHYSDLLCSDYWTYDVEDAERAWTVTEEHSCYS